LKPARYALSIELKVAELDAFAFIAHHTIAGRDVWSFPVMPAFSFPRSGKLNFSQAAGAQSAGRVGIALARARQLSIDPLREPHCHDYA
jgi:hypothetical protein